MISAKDLEYLFQDIIRKPTLDQELKKDLQLKRADSKYLDMLVRGSAVPFSLCYSLWCVDVCASNW